MLCRAILTEFISHYFVFVWICIYIILFFSLSSFFPSSFVLFVLLFVFTVFSQVFSSVLIAMSQNCSFSFFVISLHHSFLLCPLLLRCFSSFSFCFSSFISFPQRHGYFFYLSSFLSPLFFLSL